MTAKELRTPRELQVKELQNALTAKGIELWQE